MNTALGVRVGGGWKDWSLKSSGAIISKSEGATRIYTVVVYVRYRIYDICYNYKHYNDKSCNKSYSRYEKYTLECFVKIY